MIQVLISEGASAIISIHGVSEETLQKSAQFYDCPIDDLGNFKLLKFYIANTEIMLFCEDHLKYYPQEVQDKLAKKEG